jgi:hypothetical protein
MYEFNFDTRKYKPLRNRYNRLLYASPKQELQQAIQAQMKISIGLQAPPAMVLVVELSKNEDNQYELTEVLDKFPFEDLTAVLDEGE